MPSLSSHMVYVRFAKFVFILSLSAYSYAQGWTSLTLPSLPSTTATPFHGIPCVNDPNDVPVIALWTGSGSSRSVVVATWQGSSWSTQTIVTLPSDDSSIQVGTGFGNVCGKDLSLCFDSAGNLFLAVSYSFSLPGTQQEPLRSEHKVRIYKRTGSTWSTPGNPFGQFSFQENCNYMPVPTNGSDMRIVLDQNNGFNSGNPLLAILDVTEPGDLVNKRLRVAATISGNFTPTTIISGVVDQGQTPFSYTETDSTNSPVGERGLGFDSAQLQFVITPTSANIVIQRGTGSVWPQQHLRATSGTQFQYSTTFTTGYNERYGRLAQKSTANDLSMFTNEGGGVTRRNFSASTSTWGAPIFLSGTNGTSVKAARANGLLSTLLLKSNSSDNWYVSQVLPETRIYSPNQFNPEAWGAIPKNGTAFFTLGNPNGTAHKRVIRYQ